MPKLVGTSKHSGPTLTGGTWKRKQGQLIAELELGARSHSEIQCVELHYALGSLPKVGLGKPLLKLGSQCCRGWKEKAEPDATRNA